MIVNRATKIYREFPPNFWTLMSAMFIDHLGGALLFPFFALYITWKFDVGMTEVGYLFAIFSIASFAGNMVAGALTDKFGRRWMLIFGLVVSALSSLLMAFVDSLPLFYVLTGFVGLLSEAGGPAQQAMVADLLPQEKHAEGYGMMRVIANLAVTVGPAVGGVLAAKSYLLLFIADAVSSLITAVVVYFALPETKPEIAEHEEQNFTQTMVGYKFVFRDTIFMAFLFVSILGLIVYIQMYSTLSVYLNEVFGTGARGYGFLFSMNAVMVVLFQFWITRRISNRPPLLMLALGTAIFGVGFLMYGFVGVFWLFMVAMAIITIGEMIISPVGQAFVAQLAPADMRGRYMAMFGFAWAVPHAVGPLLAGLIMDNTDPRRVWYAAGIVSAVAVVGYSALHFAVRNRLQPVPDGDTPLPSSPE